MKRTRQHTGLAICAVGALAVTGLAVTPSPAQAAGIDIHLLSLYASGHRASTAYDGTDNSVRLTAESSDLLGTITFQYNANPNAAAGASGWTDITDTATSAGPYYSVDWIPDASLVGTSVAVRAAITDGGVTSYAARNSVPLTSDTPPASVSVLAVSDLGYFVQPYAGSHRTATEVAVHGTTSATDGDVELAWWRASDGTFRGRTDAQVSLTSFKLPGSITFVDGGFFDQLLDISGFDAGTGDVIAIGAAGDTDHVAPSTLYSQTISTVDAAASGEARTDRTADVVVTVHDAMGSAVGGAEVRRESDGSLVGYTDSYGQVTAQQQGGTSETYYANTTDTDAYEAGTDVASSAVTVTSYVGTATSASADSRDGTVFDRDEYQAGDLAVVVDDQDGVPFTAGYDVQYKLYPTGGPVPSTYSTATTDADGRAAVAFAAAQASGSYTLELVDPGGTTQTFVFTTGDATLTLSPDERPDTAKAGGSISYSASLLLPDGNPLPRRAIKLSYRRGVENVPGTGADAGIVSGSKLVTSSELTTAADGTFTFTIADRKESPTSTEDGGKVTAATADNVAGTSSTDTGTLTGNAAEQATATTRFGSGKGRAGITLSGDGHRAKNDELAVAGPTSLAGEKVKIYRVAGKKRTLVRTVALDRTGRARHVVVKDTNRAGRTTYVAVLVESRRVHASTSGKLTLG